jgi:hypothetical protein
LSNAEPAQRTARFSIPSIVRPIVSPLPFVPAIVLLTDVYVGSQVDIPMTRVKMNAKHEYEFIANFKVMQNVFKAKRIDKAR